jgi:hypothetical protein
MRGDHIKNIATEAHGKSKNKILIATESTEEHGKIKAL